MISAFSGAGQRALFQLCSLISIPRSRPCFANALKPALLKTEKIQQVYKGRLASRNILWTWRRESQVEKTIESDLHISALNKPSNSQAPSRVRMAVKPSLDWCHRLESVRPILACRLHNLTLELRGRITCHLIWGVHKRRFEDKKTLSSLFFRTSGHPNRRLIYGLIALSTTPI